MTDVEDLNLVQHARTLPSSLMADDGLRELFSTIAKPVAVLGYLTIDARPHGLTIGSLTGVSLDPPLILFSIARAMRRYSAVRHASRYCFSLLAEDQDDVGQKYARSSTSGFEGPVEFRGDLPGVPAAAAWFVGSQVGWFEAGDHTVVVVHVEDGARSARLPLLYYRRKYRGLRETIPVGGILGCL